MIFVNLSDYHKYSREKIDVMCDFKITDTCRSINNNTYKSSIASVGITKRKNDNKDICMYCSRHIKASGRNSKTCKYKNLDDCFFNNIDTEYKAYMLGWIASDGHIHPSGYVIKIEIAQKDTEILETLKNRLEKSLELKYRTRTYKKKKTHLVRLQFCSKQIVTDVCRHLEISRGKKSDKIKLPLDLINSKYFKDFLRGIFDGDGSIRKSNKIKKYFGCSITSSSSIFLENIKNIFGGYISKYKNKETWKLEMGFNSGKKFLDFIYKDADPELKLNRKYQRYLSFKKIESLKIKLGKKHLHRKKYSIFL